MKTWIGAALSAAVVLAFPLVLAAQQPASAVRQGKPLIDKQFDPVPDSEWTPAKPWVGREVSCENGKAKAFGCKDVSLLAYLPEYSLGGGALSDVWGWTDTATGREFAIVGRAAGTSFVEITDPVNPRFVGELPMTKGANASTWRDIKVYKHHAFIVSDASGQHGMQIFDLTKLRDVTYDEAPAFFEETAHYGEIASAHNVVIDEATGFAFVVGSGGGGQSCGGGLHMVNIQEPTKPTFAGCYAESKTGRAGTGYIHDAQCAVYHGPDSTYRGKELCFNAAETALSIADVSDKSKPKTLSVTSYPNVAYAHQGWLSSDHRYFFLGDELDEDGSKMTRTMIFDISDLDDPVLAKEFFGTTTSIDHNLYVLGKHVFQSNYKAGLRVLDASDPANPKEVAYFDTTPELEGGGYDGSWSNYPYFRSGVIAISSINQGLYLVKYQAGGSPGN